MSENSIHCPKCGEEIQIGYRPGLTFDIRALLAENPAVTPAEIFEILLKRNHPVQYQKSPLASIWTTWSRIRKQSNSKGEKK